MSDRGDSAGPEDSFRFPEPNDRSDSSAPASDRDGQGESGPAAAPGSRSRRTNDTGRLADLDALSLATLLLPIPWYLLSIGVVYWTGTLFVAEPWARTILGVWLLSGAAMLWRPIEEGVTKTVLQLRHPIQAESEKVAPAWAAVTQGAQRESADYSLLIEESNNVSAAGSRGRVVAVTRSSVTRPSTQLEAILAHELGHRVEGYGSMGAVGVWYSLPARAATWWIRNFGRLMRGAPAIGCLISGFVSLGLLGVLLAALITDHVPLALLGLVFVLLAPLLLAWVDRQAEMTADKVAARWGYGPALLEVLSEVHAQEQGSKRGASVLSGQPGVADRIRALERYLSRTSR